MRLHLHVRHGDEYYEDTEGADFETLEAVREEAIASAREIMSERVKKGRPAIGSSFEIANEAGEVLLVVPFSDAITDLPPRNGAPEPTTSLPYSTWDDIKDRVRPGLSSAKPAPASKGWTDLLSDPDEK